MTGCNRRSSFLPSSSGIMGSFSPSKHSSGFDSQPAPSRRRTHSLKMAWSSGRISSWRGVGPAAGGSGGRSGRKDSSSSAGVSSALEPNSREKIDFFNSIPRSFRSAFGITQKF